MVTMNSEKSACRRKQNENTDIGGTTDRLRNRDSQINQYNNQNDEAVDKSPSSPTYHITASCVEDTPNFLVYQKVTVQIFNLEHLIFFQTNMFVFQMENIVEKMSDEVTGVPVKTVKNFMTKTPSVFTGNILVI